MILTAHILVGAALGAKLGNPALIIPAAYLSHVVLDAFPHWEYTIDGLEEKKYDRGFLRNILKVCLDLLVGFSFVSAFAFIKDPSLLFMMMLGGFFGALPDAITFISWHTGNRILARLNHLHRIIQIPNRLRKKRKPSLWIIDPESGGILFEAIAIAVSCFVILIFL